jgi:hypothetical protein
MRLSRLVLIRQSTHQRRHKGVLFVNLGMGTVLATAGEEYRGVLTGKIHWDEEPYKECTCCLHETSSSFSGPRQGAACRLPDTIYLKHLTLNPHHPTTLTMVAYVSLLLLSACSALANPLFPRHQQPASTITVTAPSAQSTAWNAGAVPNYPIHASCNATQKAYIEKGLQETITMCRQARDHILRWGNSSAIYRKYFGAAATGEPLGWFTKIADGDKAGTLFRCDNIDGNCALPGP